VSGSADVQEGARAAVLTADGLFRLDVVVVPDSLRLLVRNFTDAELVFEPEGYPRPVLSQSDLSELDVWAGHHQVVFTIGEVQARVTLATLRSLGNVRVTAQAMLGRVSTS